MQGSTNFQSALQAAQLSTAGWSSNVSLNRFGFAADQLVGNINNVGGKTYTNFDNNYTEIDNSYPAAQAQTLQVQSTDTLRVLASRVYGDSSLWYLIANENGLTQGPDDALSDVTSVRIPNNVASLKNDASVFKPFNAQDALGALGSGLDSCLLAAGSCSPRVHFRCAPMDAAHFLCKNVSWSMPACLRMARSVPSGISPGWLGMVV